jgi:thiol-disulfide isomerase/thioredoxin
MPAPGDAQPGRDAELKREPALKVGDRAPKLAGDKWVKGEAVKGFDAGKVYVVEFWATWCPPCVKSIPHLTEIQRKHKGIVVIGVAGSERPPAEGEPDGRLAKVEGFVKDQGDKMEYRVLYDATRAMPKAWMEPAGRGGIPCAFIVGGDGKIAWIGHPAGMDEPLEKAVQAAKGKA